MPDDPKRPKFFDKERPTGILCEACGGDYEDREETSTMVKVVATCRWCVEGVMSPIQLRAWRLTRGR